ncbi:hypothetical protein BT67DRAFT_213785 [Trichocladium antarcticum]|uniref:Uncharacterized protein n=1 Tax=Trichocladium antarcticum TaxID=1450529 RepID=A0AAN6UCQ0_9PEZI|nr:hypothetical protein BT67DRAFT_213785 [Trichocladium antarcticum]
MDALTPLLQSLMIGNGNSAMTTGITEPKLEPELEPRELVPQSRDSPSESPSVSKWFLRPGQPSDLSQPSKSKFGSGSGKPEAEPEPQLGCVRCKLPIPTCLISCCKRKLCGSCFTKALNAAILTNVWDNLGLQAWVACLAKACATLKAPQDIVVDSAEALSSSPAAQHAIALAQSTREAIHKVRPRPAQREIKLAKHLHTTLADLGLMSVREIQPAEAVSVTLFPVRAGFLTQPVPILTGMFKTETKTCISCSAAFQTVDANNQAAWGSVSSAFPGDWTWMVLGRPSKPVLPECAEKHSLDICPTCLVALTEGLAEGRGQVRIDRKG